MQGAARIARPAIIVGLSFSTANISLHLVYWPSLRIFRSKNIRERRNMKWLWQRPRWSSLI